MSRNYLRGLAGSASVLAVTLTSVSFPVANAAPDLPGGGTTDVHADPSGDIAHLTAVRMGEQDGYDRLVLEFADRVPGYTIGYRPLPAHQDGSGFEIPLPGAGALLQMSMLPATGSGWAGGEQSYFGPPTVTADTTSVTEAAAAGDFEATLTWVAGVRSEIPFRVQVLDSPPRLVVDVAHEG